MRMNAASSDVSSCAHGASDEHRQRAVQQSFGEEAFRKALRSATLVPRRSKLTATPANGRSADLLFGAIDALVERRAPAAVGEVGVTAVVSQWPGCWKEALQDSQSLSSSHFEAV